jgi:hypothetical protein
MDDLRHRLERARTRIEALACVLTILLTGPMSVAAQGLFTEQSTLIASLPSINYGGRVALDGDTALVGSAEPGWVTVFDREPATDTWREVTQLSAEGFFFALSGNTALVTRGGGAAVYVFERNQGGANTWGQVAILTGYHPHVQIGSGGSVSIKGDTAVVGVPLSGPVTPSPGVAYVFERNRGGANAWGKVATLLPGIGGSGLIDNFGGSVALDGDTILVGAVLPFRDTPGQPIGFTSIAGYVFQRHHGGPNVWGQVKALPFTEPPHEDVVLPQVAIDGNTAVLGSVRLTGSGSLYTTGAHVFVRDQGGPNAWGRVATLIPVNAPVFSDFNISVSGDMVGVTSVVSDQEPGIVHVYARNQGSSNGWGRIDKLVASEGDWTHGVGLAMSGDTVLTGDPTAKRLVDRNGAAFVFVADVDGDGVRDGIDPCPRDPLNNVPGKCRRAVALTPIVDHFVALTAVKTAWVNGDYVVSATFKNTSQTSIRNPFFGVDELTGGNVLKNADGGPGGIGATLSPDVGNGVLEPGEAMTVSFTIGLKTRSPFRFIVNVRGDPE